MKPFLLTAFTLLLAPSALRAAGFVHETDMLLTSAADVDGDSDEDVVIVHRPTGIVTIGIRQPDGTVLFRTPAPSGVPNATGLAVGRLLTGMSDTLAITGPDANRVQIVNAAAPALQPMVASHPAAGPRHIAALDIPAAGTAGLDDMVVVAGWQGLLPLESRRMVNNGSGSFTASTPAFFNAEIKGWNPITLTRGGTPKLGFIELASPIALFRVGEPAVAALYYLAGTQPPPGVTKFIYGQFDAAESDFIFYSPASLSVTTRRIDPAGTAFYEPLTFNFPAPIRELVRLPDAARDRVLVIPYLGIPAVYDYDGATGFTLVEETPPTGEAPEEAGAAIAFGDGSFILLHGDNAHQLPKAFSVYQRDGSGYIGIQGGIPLPKLDEAPGVNGNVFFFAGTPMREDNPPLVGMWSVGDWSSNLTLGGSPTVFGETFQGTATGLAGAFSRAITPLPAGTLGALPNQFMPDISVSNLSSTPAALGDASSGVAFSPDTATPHRTAVRVRITATDPGATLHFRQSSGGPFGVYAGPFWIFTDTQVEAYATLPGGRRTPVARAHYTFDPAVRPKDQDSDSDGVPDFVEVARGLDPDGGADTDGDGFSDLDEILANTSPSNAHEHPDPDTRPATAAQLQINVTPLPLDGSTNFPAYAQQNVTVECHDVGGVLLGAGKTTLPANKPAAQLVVDPVDAQQRLLVISTPAHFGIQTGDADKQRGRELVGLVPVPDAPVVNPAFHFDPSMSPAVQANAWRDAYAAALAAAQRTPVEMALNVDDVLAFVMMETRLGLLLSYRGIGGSVDPASFTSFRVGERSPHYSKPLTAKNLLEIERPAAGAAPEWATTVRVREFLAQVNTLVQNSSNHAGMTALKKTAREIYRISSGLHNASPSTYASPLDTLRKFFRFHQLDEAYQGKAALTPQEIDDARNFVTSFVFSSPSRPVVRLTLKAPGHVPGEGRSLATSLNGSITYELLDARGNPYELPEAFVLPQGAQILVTAYDDLAPASGPRPLEVLAVSLTVVPEPGVNDADGNLLNDDWEMLFLGRTGNDAFSIPPGSSHSLLQQSLAGTDPADPANTPAEAPVVFDFADVIPAPERAANGDYTLYFQWPTAYLNVFSFMVYESPDLTTFSPRLATITHLGNGLHQAVITGASNPRAFYRVGVRLR